ncbi:MAG: signal peptidase I, partial [Egibacteraceae bacterium]
MKSTRSGWSSSSPAEDAGAVVGAEPAAQGASQPRSFLAELPVLVLIAFVLALVLKTFLVQAFYIPSQSMEPTLQVNDRVLVNKVVYRLREPHRGEVIVFANPDVMAEEQGNVVERVLRDLGSGLGMSQPFEKDFIKRIIGLPGETVEMRDGVVLVDGRPLPE